MERVLVHRRGAACDSRPPHIGVSAQNRRAGGALVARVEFDFTEMGAFFARLKKVGQGEDAELFGEGHQVGDAHAA